jgi:hypothetical protein
MIEESVDFLATTAKVVCRAHMDENYGIGGR